MIGMRAKRRTSLLSVGDVAVLRMNHIWSVAATATPPVPGLRIAAGQLVIALTRKVISDIAQGGPTVGM
jgi:hypothetical protein